MAPSEIVQWCARLLLKHLPPVLFLDFAVSHTFCVPEDPAGLLTDRLAGKCAIKTSLQVEIEVQRPAGVVPSSKFQL